MKIRLMAGVLSVAFTLCVSAAMACPKEDGAKTADGKKPCGSQAVATAGSAAIVVADVAKDGRSEGTPEIKKSSGCSKGKTAQLTADTASSGTITNCPHSGKPCSDGDCPMAKKVSAILASMPAIQYRIGAETTGCSKSASSMAEKNGKSIDYLVGDDVFESKGKAIAKLTSLLGKEIETMKSIQFVAGGKCHGCPMTAKSVAKSSNTTVAYRVAGVDFKKKSDAKNAVDAIAKAAAKVSMSYKVDGKSYGCEKMAGSNCKKSGKEMTYVIGDTETGCHTSAKLRLTEAKIRAMVEVAVAAVHVASTS